MTSLPAGTLTLLFTDIEGSTQLLQRLGERYEEVLAGQRRILGEEIGAHGGQVVDTEGDGLFAVFTTAADAVAASAVAQQRLAATAWPDDAKVRVRAGLHTGEARLIGHSYVGIDVHRAARIAAAGHGGQVLLSAVTRSLVEQRLPSGVSLIDLGSHRLKDLEQPEHLFQLRIGDLPSDFPPPRTLDGTTHNLPEQLTTFVGRHGELAALRALLERSRLVTLTGPGGAGKTRLGLQVAGDVAAAFRDGAHFVALASVREPSLIAPTVARVLGIEERPEEPVASTLLRQIDRMEALLLLDNFEHLAAGASIVTDLLKAAPGVRVLVTSRALLHLSGEHEYPVPPLELPDAGSPLEVVSRCDAIRLFVQRAQAASPAFELDGASASAVAEICRRLDGLPLAIELAAARVRVFTLTALRDRLQGSTTLLSGGPRDVPDRQRTLRDTIAWSYDLLAVEAQTLFRRLGVFLRGCTVDAAMAVADPDGELGVDVLDALIGLADESLLRSERSDAGEPRFRMLETIREFAWLELDRAGELNETARRHADHFAAMVEEAEPHLAGPEQLAWLGRIGQDHDNIRAALRWSIDADVPEVGMRIGAALWRFWLRRGHLREGRRWLEEILALPTTADARQLRARALTALGGLAYWQADYSASGAAYRESLQLYRDLANPAGMAAAQYNLGYIETIAGDLEAAWTLHSAARAIHAELGDEHAFAYDGLGLGLVAILRRDWEAARQIAEEMVAEQRRLRDQWALGNGLIVMSRVMREDGDHRRAWDALREALHIFREAEDLAGVSMVLGASGALLAAQGELEAALHLAGGGEAVEEQMGGRAPIELRPYEDAREVVRGSLDPVAVARGWEEGRSLSLDELAALVERHAAVA